MIANSKEAMSLIELTIVIIVLALIAVAVTSGQSLVTSARIQSTVSEMKEIVSQYDQFKLMHGVPPGTLANFKQKYGENTCGNGTAMYGRVRYLKLRNTTTTKDCFNGPKPGCNNVTWTYSNYFMPADSETILLWCHLKWSGIRTVGVLDLELSTNDIDENTHLSLNSSHMRSHYRAGINMPKSKFGNGALYVIAESVDAKELQEKSQIVLPRYGCEFSDKKPLNLLFILRPNYGTSSVANNNATHPRIIMGANRSFYGVMSHDELVKFSIKYGDSEADAKYTNKGIVRSRIDVWSGSKCEIERYDIFKNKKTYKKSVYVPAIALD